MVFREKAIFLWSRLPKSLASKLLHPETTPPAVGEPKEHSQPSRDAICALVKVL
jgi:hypothetical protein